MFLKEPSVVDSKDGSLRRDLESRKTCTSNADNIFPVELFQAAMRTFTERKLTLAALYGEKSAGLVRFLGTCQGAIQQWGDDAFVPSQMEQLHATIVGLEAEPGKPQVNSAFRRLRGLEKRMNILGLLESVRSSPLLPFTIRFGGFLPGHSYGFTSRGLHPYDRSFSCSASKFVLIGWPLECPQRSCDGTSVLATLRKSLESFGVLHTYHGTSAEVDNDFYMRLGTCVPQRESQVAGVVQRVREYLAENPFELTLECSDISLVSYLDSTLPTSTTMTAHISDLDACLRLLRSQSGV